MFYFFVGTLNMFMMSAPRDSLGQSPLVTPESASQHVERLGHKNGESHSGETSEVTNRLLRHDSCVRRVRHSDFRGGRSSLELEWSPAEAARLAVDDAGGSDSPSFRCSAMLSAILCRRIYFGLGAGLSFAAPPEPAAER